MGPLKETIKRGRHHCNILGFILFSLVKKTCFGHWHKLLKTMYTSKQVYNVEDIKTKGLPLLAFRPTSGIIRSLEPFTIKCGELSILVFNIHAYCKTPDNIPAKYRKERDNGFA